MLYPSDSVESIRRLFERILVVNEARNQKNHADPIIVSFDIAHGNKKGFSAIGVSFLDTRCLKGLETRKFSEHDHPLIWTQTYNFNYSVSRTRKGALFDGDAQKVSSRHRNQLLTHIFSHYDDNVEPCCGSHIFQPFQPSESQSVDARTAVRPVIIVGHSISQDIASLQRAGFDIAQVAAIACIDTQRTARDLFWKDNASKNISLKELCKLRGIQPQKLHNSGNDAAYTLLVLLSLAHEILGHNATARGILDGFLQGFMGFRKTARQKRRETRQGGSSKDWADYLDEENRELVSTPSGLSQESTNVVS
ncbi:uncharacterized protein K460DRAFT_422832 [Cucurbitaria berberidis CBS 394.84]|uniref:Gfd2/YDR514C-like C-terminal domain-containing protein n=1 Tax=Cucurbitaria berberidis CBS 394.84 TaxID=1168544 RepID=A0A9P4GRW3_9PLEO|nr:uncharacterized protein K460DRAFT_422832 [Cucurbitaria berberidis CBS 394.84]KAF1850394.1 hypothetical protein K460DRAFT_422832 [Cucurbitaria berberidis CBS 394.84]